MKTRTIQLRDSRGRKLEFAINPDAVSIDDSMQHNEVDIYKLGKVLVPGRKGLRNIQLNTFIPASDSPFKGGKGIKEALKLLESWESNAVKLRCIITNPTINIPAVITTFTRTYREGQRDINISVSLKEIKTIAVPSVPTIEGKIAVGEPALKTRESSIESGRTELANRKTSLWGLAVKYYGDGAQWRKIAAANGDMSPDSIKEGMTIIIP